MIGLLAETFGNKDFYGTEIRNADDPFVKQAWDETKHFAQGFEPFGIKNAITQFKRGDTGAKPFMSFVGITPAPRAINTTPAEQLAMDNITENLPRGARTQEQADKSKFNLEALRLLQTARKTTGLVDRQEAIKKYQDHVQQGLASGMTDSRKVMELSRDANLSTIQYLFKRQPNFKAALDVFEEAKKSGQDKELVPLLHEKWQQSRMSTQERRDMLPAYYEALGIKPLKKAA